MGSATKVTRDVIGDIQTMDEREQAAAFKRWVGLSELVAPRDEEEDAEPERPGDRP